MAEEGTRLNSPPPTDAFSILISVSSLLWLQDSYCIFHQMLECMLSNITPVVCSRPLSLMPRVGREISRSLRDEFFLSLLWRWWLCNRKVIQSVKGGRSFVGGDNLTGALCILYLQLWPPPTSSLAPVESGMESCWYWPTWVILENGR